MMLFLLQDFCQKNTEHMRPEVVSLLRSSEQSFFHHLVASSPEAVFRWGVLRAILRIMAAFKIIGRRRAELSRSLSLFVMACFEQIFYDWLIHPLIHQLHGFYSVSFSLTDLSCCHLSGGQKRLTEVPKRHETAQQYCWPPVQVSSLQLMDFVSPELFIPPVISCWNSQIYYYYIWSGFRRDSFLNPEKPFV